MSWWIRLQCDGNRNGRRCNSGEVVRADIEVAKAVAHMQGWRKLADVLSPETHMVSDDEHLCPQSGHGEEQPGYGSQETP